LREFYVDDASVPRAQAAQFLANGTGIVWVIEPYLTLTIGGPPAIPAGIPTGDFTGSEGMRLKGRIFVDTLRMPCLVNG
jgi:hypothetical protein